MTPDMQCRTDILNSSYNYKSATYYTVYTNTNLLCFPNSIQLIGPPQLSKHFTDTQLTLLTCAFVCKKHRYQFFTF